MRQIAGALYPITSQSQPNPLQRRTDFLRMIRGGSVSAALLMSIEINDLLHRMLCLHSENAFDSRQRKGAIGIDGCRNTAQKMKTVNFTVKCVNA